MSSDDHPWRSSPRHEAPTETVRWRPLADLDRVGLKLGLSDAGCWVVIGPSSATEIQGATRPVFLFPILQMSFAEALNALTAAIKAHDGPPEVLGTFPVEALVVAALDSGSPHWSSMALAWVAEMPASPGLATALARLVETGSTQAIRHSARRIGQQLSDVS